MSSADPQRYLVLMLVALAVSQSLGISLAAHVSEPMSRITEVSAQAWREASPTRIIVSSTADWGRILFDDFNGTNSNGIRIRSVVNSGWLEGRGSDEQLYVGRKISWPDTEYDQIVARRGDMVAFFKGLGDFHYVEAYADLILEVNLDLPRVYVWLMTGGNGTTTFEIVSQDTGGTIWRDIVVGTGETQQVRRVMSPQPFFRPGRTESSIVVAWLSIAILVMIVLNFPILEVLKEGLRRKWRTRKAKHHAEHVEAEK